MQSSDIPSVNECIRRAAEAAKLASNTMNFERKAVCADVADAWVKIGYLVKDSGVR